MTHQRSWSVLALVLSVVLGACAGRSDIEGVQSFEFLSRAHKAGRLSYAQTPPVGSTHNPTWQNCGVYRDQVADEYAVHSMEHGAVWITYRDDLPRQGVDALAKLAQGRTHVLVFTVPNLPAAVVASARGVQLLLERPADPRLAKFVTKYENGPQTPEPGAPCSGGVATSAAP